MRSEIARHWHHFLKSASERLDKPVPLQNSGTLTRASGLALEGRGLRVPVGAQCLVEAQGQAPMLAEVVGFTGPCAHLMPAGVVQGLRSGASIRPAPAFNASLRWGAAPEATRPPATEGTLTLPMGRGLLGRVIDAQGTPMDRAGQLVDVAASSLDRSPINAMDREPVRLPLDTGVRAINALLTVGRGQRLGLFAGSGVGKSVLLGMMARYTAADVIVVGLIGERGREVKEFIEEILGHTGRARSVVVAAPADAPPLLRLQGADYASSIAEYFRDQGQHVLLLMDSLTRYAMAQREIALAIGEPPATKGYPPSCFARLPQLVERSGNGPAGGGSITAFYTVLTEGDDQQDPIADAARAILDGHIVLTRALAEEGHYPAIDVAQSASRVMHNVVAPAQVECARRFRALQASYARGRDLLQVGAYVPGSDQTLDQAIEKSESMNSFLRQGMNEASDFRFSIDALQALMSPGQSADRAQP
jgi:flagellum-specific ATP synthase